MILSILLLFFVGGILWEWFRSLETFQSFILPSIHWMGNITLLGASEWILLKLCSRILTVTKRFRYLAAKTHRWEDPINISTKRFRDFMSGISSDISQLKQLEAFNLFFQCFVGWATNRTRCMNSWWPLLKGLRMCWGVPMTWWLVSKRSVKPQP